VSYEEALAYTTLVAFAVAVVHVTSPWVRRRVHGRWEQLAPLSSGALASYIFLHMIPSIAEAEVELGMGVAAVLLAGFALYYGLEGYLDEHPGHLFWVKVAVGWFYTFLIVYSLPSAFERSTPAALVGFLALALHLLQSDNHLAAEHPEPFDRSGRWVLATAPLVAVVLDVVVGPPDSEATAFMAAFVSGMLLLGLFRDELGNRLGQRRFGLFLVGVAIYGSLVLLEEVL
jgi:hypothetical protein